MSIYQYLVDRQKMTKWQKILPVATRGRQQQIQATSPRLF